MNSDRGTAPVVYLASNAPIGVVLSCGPTDWAQLAQVKLMRPRVLAYAWASPATAIGLVVALLACVRGRLRVHSGVVEADGPLLAWCLRSLVPIRGGAAALTIGHVVIGRDGEALAGTRAHERVHVGQYERWGVFFFPAYLVASLWAAARGQDFYLDNRFEREARAHERDVTESARRWPQSTRHGYEH